MTVPQENNARPEAAGPLAGPLAGVTVIDLTRALAGPYGTMLLGELGARIVKVEPPGGDPAREIGPHVAGQSAYFMSLNRGKESIVLDLKDAADRRVFEAMLRRADVLYENYRAGTMEKLGYGWDALKGLNPRLVYAATSGFGQTGPYSHRPAYDMVVQAMGGIVSITGHPGGPPTRVGMSIGDIAAGLFTALGVVSALQHRNRTGEGMMVDVAMLDSQVALLENAVARYSATGVAPGPLGARHPSVAPFDAFRTADGHIVVAAGHEDMFRRFSETVGRPDWPDDPRFATLADRLAHVDALKAEIEAVLATGTSDHWHALLEAADIPCGPINTVPDLFGNAHIAARKMIVNIDDPDAGTMAFAGLPIKMSAYADRTTRPPAPRLDEHGARLREEFGEAPA
ncbi:MAG: CoA transferase [Rhodospirillaceae bacterium]|nr:CoA transferase [Rhodospirillaceae bacterium]